MPVIDRFMATSNTGSDKNLLLSERQQQILGLLAEGKSNKEIAEDLAIELGTVKQHLFVLFRKLGVASRAKATIVAEQLLKTNNGRFVDSNKHNFAVSKKGAATKNAERYQWRLISAVSLVLPDFVALANQFETISLRNHFLVDMQKEAQSLLDSLDGQLSISPDGNLVAWFGHPNTHLDDSDRAAYYAQHMFEWMAFYTAEHLKTLTGKTNLGVGVASQPELVEEGIKSLYAADAYRKATLLAQHSKVLRRPLSDKLTNKLSPYSVPWLDIRTRDGNKAVEVKQVGEIYAIGPSSSPLVDCSSQWGGLPFMGRICDAVQEGVAQWLSVESWPPLAASTLMDAIGNYAHAKGILLLRLRAPNNNRRDRLLASYTKQIEVYFQSLGLEEKKLYSTAGERVAGLLSQIAQSQHLMVELYGLKTLESFKMLIGDSGIDILAPRSIIIVAANLPQTGNQQTCARLLGSRPNDQPFSRTFTMIHPEGTVYPEGIQVDYQAILDSLSNAARAILIHAVKNPQIPLANAIAEICDSHHKAQSAIHELTSFGLIVPGLEGNFEFRDQGTIEAIRKSEGISMATS